MGRKAKLKAQRAMERQLRVSDAWLSVTPALAASRARHLVSTDGGRDAFTGKQVVGTCPPEHAQRFMDELHGLFPEHAVSCMTAPSWVNVPGVADHAGDGEPLSLLIAPDLDAAQLERWHTHLDTFAPGLGLGHTERLVKDDA